MKTSVHNITEDLGSGFFGRRQTAWKYDAETKMEVIEDKDIEAGLTCYFNYMSHIRLFLKNKGNKKEIVLVRREGNRDTVLENIL